MRVNNLVELIAFFTIFFITYRSLSMIFYSSRVLKKLMAERQSFLERRSNKEKKNQYIFFILVPLFDEALILSSVFRKFCNAFSNRPNCQVVFITSVAEVEKEERQSVIDAINQLHVIDKCSFQPCSSTPKMLHNIFSEFSKKGELPNNFFHTINTNEKEFGKYAQLNAGLSAIQNRISDRDFIGVYDADSEPDIQALEYIQCTNEQYVAFQQLPLYPPSVKFSNFNHLLAHSRVIYNLYFSLSREAMEYITSSENARCLTPGKHVLHLVGHGEFIRYDVLQEVGGFMPPSCDTTLGFSLGLRGYSICPIPVVDVSTTPANISAIFQQGVVWYNGFSLFDRERKRLHKKWSLPLAISSFKLLNDRLQWSTYPLVTLLLILGVALIDLRASAVVALTCFYANLVKDLFGWNYYNELRSWRSLNFSPIIPFSHWIKLSLFHTMFMQWYWSIPPWRVQISRWMGINVILKKTPRN